MTRRRWLLWAPLVAFLAILAVIAWGLYLPADRIVRSAMVGKPLPDFTLPALAPGKPGLTSADFRRGSPRLLNVFASWCVPCIVEAPQLTALKAAGVPIDAVAVRDTGPAVTRFLRRNGDPYHAIGDDAESRVQLALGASGVPETFVVDGRGIIVHQHLGELRREDVADILLAIERAK